MPRLAERSSSLRQPQFVTMVFYRARAVLAFCSSKRAFWCAAAPPRPFWAPTLANALPGVPPPRPLWASTAPNAHSWWSATLPRPFWAPTNPSAHSGVLLSRQGRAGSLGSAAPNAQSVQCATAEAILGLHALVFYFYPAKTTSPPVTTKPNYNVPPVWIPFGDHPLKLERYRED